jgi:hypothetical protein
MNQPAQDIDLDCPLPEQLAVIEACQKLDKLGVRYTIRNHVLRISLIEPNAIFFTPRTGALRWPGGKIFSQKGWPELYKILIVAGLIKKRSPRGL